MPTDRPDDTSSDRASGPRPLSQRASRYFVIAAILFIIAATIGSTYYLVTMTSQALDAPPDTTQVDTTRIDTSVAQPESSMPR